MYIELTEHRKFKLIIDTGLIPSIYYFISIFYMYIIPSKKHIFN
uniref:Uncharacterized protein n=1 Tax=Myoviridae sp. ctXXl13 TaxID=2827691 RepID=A0A8S5TIW6_9CAUD|nr:MAG TPA: hypothetical protein [Myoviridae sp. ctXXl13]